MDFYNFQRAIISGKLSFKVSNGEETRYVLASSIEQCQSKFIKWNVQKVAMQDYINSKSSDIL